VVSLQRPSAELRSRDGWMALAYFAVYLTYLFFAVESELRHWVTLVAIPLILAWALLPGGRRTVGGTLASVGLGRDGFWKGVGWVLLAGALITAFQVFCGGNAQEVQALFRDGRALYLLPLAFVMMLVFAGFTEELFFRGFLQTRLEALTGRPWMALLVSALLFAAYHVPYTLLNPHWPSYGDLPAALWAAFVNGFSGGLILGGVFLWTRGRLAACIVLHAAVDVAPAMTMIHIGGK
jgi:membrane protease YdiL (CAAX protease family)